MVSLGFLVLHILQLPQPVFFHSENLTQPIAQPMEDDGQQKCVKPELNSITQVNQIAIKCVSRQITCYKDNIGTFSSLSDYRKG